MVDSRGCNSCYSTSSFDRTGSVAYLRSSYERKSKSPRSAVGAKHRSDRDVSKRVAGGIEGVGKFVSKSVTLIGCVRVQNGPAFNPIRSPISHVICDDGVGLVVRSGSSDWSYLAISYFQNGHKI